MYRNGDREPYGPFLGSFAVIRPLVQRYSLFIKSTFRALKGICTTATKGSNRSAVHYFTAGNKLLLTQSSKAKVVPGLLS